MQKNTFHRTPQVMASHHYQGSYRSVEQYLGTIKYLTAKHINCRIYTSCMERIC